jgi:formylglycine-generating enzyme required for sulfatase activity
VTGGTYFRTYVGSGDGGAGGSDPATVSGFRFDKYLVTVGRFRQFVHAVLPGEGGSGWTPPAGSGKHVHLNGGQGLLDLGASNDAGAAYESGWLTSDNGNLAPTDANLTQCGGAGADPFATWTSSAAGQEALPINCVNWYEAQAFCIWDGGFLPSEAEWEYAAAGGAEQREYPWGSTDPGTANAYAIYGDVKGTCLYPTGATCSGVANIAPVGSASQGAGLWGQLDLAGEVWEWTLDRYAAYVEPCADCADLTVAAPAARAKRGGSYASQKADLAAAIRLPTASQPAPSVPGSAPTRFDDTGFRCARTP